MGQYQSAIKKPEWVQVADEIKRRDNYTCTNCRRKKNIKLHVHHKYYVNGREPWEYPKSALITLCIRCHLSIDHDKIKSYKEGNKKLIEMEGDWINSRVPKFQQTQQSTYYTTSRSNAQQPTTQTKPYVSQPVNNRNLAPKHNPYKIPEKESAFNPMFIFGILLISVFPGLIIMAIADLEFLPAYIIGVIVTIGVPFIIGVIRK